MDMHQPPRDMDMPKFPKILTCTMEGILLDTGITSSRSSSNSSNKWVIVECSVELFLRSTLETYNNIMFLLFLTSTFM